MERRTFLRGGAAGGIVVLAGCLGGGDGSNGDGGTDGSGGDGGTGSTDGTDGDNPGNETDGADGTETQNGDEEDGEMFGPFRVFDDELIEAGDTGEVIISGSVEYTEPERDRRRPGEPPENEQEFPGIWVQLFDEDGNKLFGGPADVESLEPGETREFEVTVSVDSDEAEEYEILLRDVPVV